jgi:hypothetical protein
MNSAKTSSGIASRVGRTLERDAVERRADRRRERRSGEAQPTSELRREAHERLGEGVADGLAALGELRLGVDGVDRESRLLGDLGGMGGGSSPIWLRVWSSF